MSYPGDWLQSEGEYEQTYSGCNCDFLSGFYLEEAISSSLPDILFLRSIRSSSFASLCPPVFHLLCTLSYKKIFMDLSSPSCALHSLKYQISVDIPAVVTYEIGFERK
jgi:hypothetical protein